MRPDDVDGVRWVPYHKQGGDRRWWAEVEFAVDWRDESRQHYGIPSSVSDRFDAEVNPREGFLVSGVASRLAARMMQPGALWDSNKVFAFFPKDPDRYPPEFFCAILNSSVYGRIAKALDHTVSLQIRDLRQLPMLLFTPAEIDHLTRLGKAAIRRTRQGQPTDSIEKRIDAVVEEAWRRVVDR